MGGSIDLDYSTSAYWQAWWPEGDCPRTYMDGGSGKDVLIEKMAESVTVEGTLVKKGGTQVIYVSAVK